MGYQIALCMAGHVIFEIYLADDQHLNVCYLIDPVDTRSSRTAPARGAKAHPWRTGAGAAYEPSVPTPLVPNNQPVAT